MLAAFSMWNNSLRAFKEVPGLRASVWKAFLLNYAIFLVSVLVLNGVVYTYLLNPWIEGTFGTGDSGWAIVGTVILWGTQLIISALLVIISLIFSIYLMSLWYEHLVALVIRHFRELPEPTMNWGKWLQLQGKSVLTSLQGIAWILPLLLVGLIPVVGVVLAFVLGAHVVGKEIKIPYTVVLDTHRQLTGDLEKQLPWSFFVGWPQMALAFIPMVGWVLMPWAMIHQIVGLTFWMESQHKNSNPISTSQPQRTS